MKIPRLDTEELYGIHEIYRPPAPMEPEVDIVAVHGLNGGALRTWTTLDSGVCWLDHPEFLPKYIPNARVLVWGYNASFSSLTGDVPSRDRIHHHAHTLVANLAADRRLSGTADKPIIFLCHSLGGIVVKRALSYAQTRTGHKVAHDYLIFACTHAILFFGTPHHGSSKATWLAYLKRLGAAASLGRMSRRSDLVSALEHESETLQNITDYFVPLMRHFRIFYFWEQARTRLLHHDLRGSSRVRWWLPVGTGHAGEYIVTRESAAPAHDETERAGIAADHRGMVRFETPAAQGFRMVADALVRYCGEAGEAVRVRLGDARGVLEGEREREVAEALRNKFRLAAGGVGSSSSGGRGFVEPCDDGAPELTPATTRVQSGFDGASVGSPDTSKSFRVGDVAASEKDKMSRADSWM